MSRRRWAPGERLYRALVTLLSPLRTWVRLEVHGVENLRAPGGVLLVANHDSSVDPLALAEAAMRVRRPLRFLTRANLWRLWPLGTVLDDPRQIPIERGAGDVAPLEQAVSALHAGEAVCIFPKGDFGRETAARPSRRRPAGGGRPDARIVLGAVSGGTDLVRFPRRPRVVVELFAPQAGHALPGEDHGASPHGCSAKYARAAACRSKAPSHRTRST